MKRTETSDRLGNIFAQSANTTNKARRSGTETAKTFSLRLNEDERRVLRREAGKLPLGTYIRDKLFGDAAPLRKAVRPQKKLHRPSADQVAIARILAMLGRSDVYASMGAIARAATFGTLPVTPELMDELHTACSDISAMRALLVGALGAEGGGGRDPGR